MHRIIIPEDQRDKLRDPCCELDTEFLCFDENYVPIAAVVPRDYVIIDLGCYMAAQAFLFEDHQAYIGVDAFDMNGGKPRNSYIPPRRFTTSNSMMLSMTIQEFLKKFHLLGLDKERCYCICSAVPDFSATDEALQFFPNCACFYPGRASSVQGRFKDQVMTVRSECLIEKGENQKGEIDNGV